MIAIKRQLCVAEDLPDSYSLLSSHCAVREMLQHVHKVPGMKPKILLAATRGKTEVIAIDHDYGISTLW